MLQNGIPDQLIENQQLIYPNAALVTGVLAISASSAFLKLGSRDVIGRISQPLQLL
jgi:hypothetical protein